MIQSSPPSGNLFGGEGGGGGGGGGGGSSTTLIEDPQNPGANISITGFQGNGTGQLSFSGTLSLATVSGNATITGARASITCGVTGNASVSLTIMTPGGSSVLNCPKTSAPGMAMTVSGQVSFSPVSSFTETITLFLSAPASSDSVIISGFSLQVSIPSAAPIPFVSAVENAATGQIKDATHGVAANSFIAIYGGNMGTATSGGNIFPAKSFQGIQALFSGTAEPLYNVNVFPSFSLINLVVPSELPSAGTATLNVINSAGLSLNVTLTLAPADVGIFRFSADSAHPNSGVVTIANTAWRVMAASTAAAYGYAACNGMPVTAACGQPAHPGDPIVIYFTGGGLATPGGDPSGKPVPTGSVAPIDGSVIYRTVLTPQLTIGGIPVTAGFSGIAPGTAAEYQINTTIPTTVQTGNDVPVKITFGNSSDTVTIAIQ